MDFCCLRGWPKGKQQRISWFVKFERIEGDKWTWKVDSTRSTSGVDSESARSNRNRTQRAGCAYQSRGGAPVGKNFAKRKSAKFHVSFGRTLSTRLRPSIGDFCPVQTTSTEPIGISKSAHRQQVQRAEEDDY